MSRGLLSMIAVVALSLIPLHSAEGQRGRAADSASAPITNVRYELTFDTTTASTRTVRVSMSFNVAGAAPVLLSLPTWTPGAYEVSNFARNVSEFGAEMGGAVAAWDKLDYDTWRVRPAGAGSLTVRYDFDADSLDNAMAWSRADFAMLNGTNVFMYAEGRSLDFASQVVIRTSPGWRVVTGLHAVAGAPFTYGERNYHDLVDMPMFIGRFDVDSIQVMGKWTRIASYPSRALPAAARATLLREFAQVIPVYAGIFGEVPWDDYTQFLLFQSFGGISALEHQSSNVAVSDPQLIGEPVLTSVLAHEIFHAWNVKRLRPAAMVPYRYDVPQPTTLLWVSEGFTDYYADLGTVRAGVIDSAAFLRNSFGHVGVVANAPAVSVEDASLSIWIHPTDGTDALYYDKGSVLGLLLDIQIRDASDNRSSLDQVMRGLYDATYQRGRGFTNDEFWAAASRAAGGRSFADFYTRYVDGRDSLPYDAVLPLAGMRLTTTRTRVPRMGVSTRGDSTVSVVVSLVPGGAFQVAGVLPLDTLITVAGIDQRRANSAEEFRQLFAGREGASYPVVLRRGGRPMSLTAQVKLGDNVVTRLEFDAGAPLKAARIRAAILRGTTER